MQTDNIVTARAEFTASSVRARSFTSLLMRTTALAGLALITLPAIAALTALTATPAMAGGGTGGNGVRNDGGCTGGSDSASSAGGAGGDCSVSGGGGGGGAGVTGGTGGQGYGGTGGVGASVLGGNGDNGQNEGSGGGGGAHGYYTSGGSLPGMAVTGGNGGRGGGYTTNLATDYYGGGGGAGGWGASILAPTSGTLTVNVTGGNGGKGGKGAAYGGGGGDGGSGGTGLYLGTPGTPGATVTINSTVTGGNGGARGNGGTVSGTNGNPGDGGVGIVSNGASITVSGTGSVSGGMSGDNSTQARAINFTAGNVRLELWSGATISGNVDAYGTTSATFALGGTADGTFDITGLNQHYSNFTAFDKSGTSTWTLTGNGSFYGPATVSAGSLFINGLLSLPGGDSAPPYTITVNSGATLGGNGGVMGSVAVNNGGTLSPGATATSIGTFAVTGDLTFASGSTYKVNVSPSSASSVTVTGTATLGNATVNAVFGPGSYITNQYTILQAATRSGTFGSLVNTSLPSNFTSSLSYGIGSSIGDVYLNLTMGAPQPGGGGNLNRNQSDVSNAIANAFNGGGSVPIELATLTPAGLTQASGEVVTASQQATFNAMNMFMGILTDPYAAGRGGNASPSSPGAMSYAQQRAPRDAYAMFTKAMPQNDPFAARWTMWASGFGGSQTTNGNNAAGSNTSTSSIFGVAVGADYRISPNTLAGFGMSGGGTNFSVANGGSGRSDMLQAGGFVRHAIGASYLTAAATYAWQDVTTNRNVIGTDQLQGRFNANAFSGRFEAGTRYIIPSWMGGIGATPYAAVQVTAYDLPAYTETVQSGPGVFALGYAAKDVTSTRSELGLRTDRTYALTDSVLTLRGRFAWAHEFDPDRSIGATFQSVPGASFVVNGARQASDAALTTASAELRWRSGVSLAGIFEGEFSDVTRSYAGKGVLRYQW